MFCGIVEGMGVVQKLERGVDSARLVVQAPFALGSTKVGDSISVNGCCLTVVKKRPRAFETDVSFETLRVTSLGSLQKNDRVNLERAMRLGDRIGGHLVQGHVDGVGQMRSMKRFEEGVEVTVGFPKALRRYLIKKGSIGIDGTSMTVNDVSATTFTLFIIPHTWQKTVFHLKKQGDPVNLEVDMVGKYIETLAMAWRKTARK